MNGCRQLLLRVVPLVMALPTLALLMAACGSDDDDDDDTVDVTDATTAPESTRAATATPQAKAPTFAVGSWTGGQAEARVTGAASFTVQANLSMNSGSDKGTTRLIYADGVKTIALSISTQYQPLAVTVYDGAINVQTGSSDQPCQVTYKQSDDKHAEGSFHCEDARVDVGPTKGAVVIEGTFLATR